MLLFASPREALLACPPFPPWKVLFFTVESILSSPCSRSDLPLSHQAAAFAHLDSAISRSIALDKRLCSFFLWQGRLRRTCQLLSVAPKPLFSIWKAQYVQVSLLKPAPFCMLFAGLDSTNKSAISLLILSDSRSVHTTLFSSPSFHLLQSVWQIWQELPFLLLY